MTKHEQSLLDGLATQLDVEIRKYPKEVRRMTIREFVERGGSFVDDIDSRRGSRRYSTRSSMVCPNCIDICIMYMCLMFLFNRDFQILFFRLL